MPPDKTTETEALEKMRANGADRGLSSIDSAGNWMDDMFVDYVAGHPTITLDGDFTPAMLRLLADHVEGAQRG